MSVLQVTQIAEILRIHKMAWNRPWEGGLVTRSGLAPQSLPGGMHITILSPELMDVQVLQARWGREQAQARRGIENAEPADSDDAAQAQEASGLKRATKSSSRRRDIERGPPDVEALANTPFTDDRSQSNAASIAFLAELHGKALLVGGDARAEVLCRSIAALLAQRGQERLRVDAFAVPHAGSARNTNRELLALLECDRYLFSTDGSAFQHPDRETIARILAFGRATPNRPLTLVFNYRSPTTQIWANPQLQSRYRYRAVYPQQNGQGIKLQL
jgi:hypothetical protein